MPLMDEDAVDFIIRRVRENEAGTVTLCALGPLTNLALAFEKAPEKYEIQLSGACARMGGGVTGNPADYAVVDGEVDVEIGDGRLLLERSEPLSFDVLLILSGLRPFALFSHGFSFRRR